MQTILIVEDDTILASVLSGHLEKQGYRTIVEPSGDQAVARIIAEQPDAVILDSNLLGKDGFSVCREVRPDYPGVILMYTGRNEDLDRILGLELGADEYLLKPVEPRVVAAHLKACLRRAAPFAARPHDEIRHGLLRINRAERLVQLNGQEVPLSSAEFELLWLLASHAGTILSRDEIMSAMRNLPHDGQDRSIDMRISRLRKHLGDDAEKPRKIKTVRSKGYLFSRTDWG